MKLSFDIPLLSSSKGQHRLPVNKVLLNHGNLSNSHNCHQLWSGGRDGLITAHDITAVPDSYPTVTLTATMATHTDWVNDLCFIGAGKFIVSASSDCTLQIHSTSATDDDPGLKTATTPLLSIGNFKSCGSYGSCLESHGCRYVGHTDYIQALCASDYAQTMASAGLDKRLLLWNTSTMQQHLSLDLDASSVSQNAEQLDSIVPFAELTEFDSGVYGLDCAPDGSLIAASCIPDNIVRLFDPRSGKQEASLIGHSDCVRSLMISSDGERLLSASSDKSVKLWSLSSRRCLQTFPMEDSVWTLACFAKNFDTFYAGTRRGKCLEFRHTRDDDYACRALFDDVGPITSLAVDQCGSIWSSNSVNSSVSCWTVEYVTPQEGQRVEPSFQIEGNVGLVKHYLCDNKRWVLTQDQEGALDLWDIPNMCKIESIAEGSFEDNVKLINATGENAAAWCSVDLKCGLVNVTLEEPRCYEGEAYPDELGVECEDMHSRLNLCKYVIDKLFMHLDKTTIREQPSEIGLNTTLSSDNLAVKPREKNSDSAQSSAGVSRVSSSSDTSRLMSQFADARAAASWEVLTTNTGQETMISLIESSPQKAIDHILRRFSVGQVASFDKSFVQWCPMWIYRVLKKDIYGVQPKEIVKISFMLYPQGDLPQMPEGMTKLMTNRYIRLKKIMEHVMDKLDPKPASKLEFCVGNVGLSERMYLSTCKSRHSTAGELTLFYRIKVS